jgi:hypothetical protein
VAQCGHGENDMDVKMSNHHVQCIYYLKHIQSEKYGERKWTVLFCHESDIIKTYITIMLPMSARSHFTCFTCIGYTAPEKIKKIVYRFIINIVMICYGPDT